MTNKKQSMIKWETRTNTVHLKSNYKTKRPTQSELQNKKKS